MKYLLCCVLTVCSYGTLTNASELTLADASRSDYVIVLPAKPAAAQATAAKELQQHLAEATGATLKIVAEGDVSAETPQIVVGPSDRLKQLLPQLDVAALAPDEIVIETVGNHLVLAGQPPRGTLYAVYTFLEDVVGCRWWTSTERMIPKKPTLIIPKLAVRYAPKLPYRDAYYRDLGDGIFAARCKFNGHCCNIPGEYGGHIRFAEYVHTFYPLLPPEKYFAEHPEWYSEIGGKRTIEHAQLCLTNEAMREQFTQNTLERLRANPDAGYISISQNDWYGRCECAHCKAVEEEEGAASGPVLRFVNAVAEAIEKEFPHVLVETLAYQYTRKPPKLARPRKNVVIRLCSIECSFSDPLDSPQNEAFRQDILGWSAIAPRLFIWDYVTNFSNYLVPHPNHRVLAPNIRFFVNHNAIGLFEQGDIGSPIGDFVRLRAWLIAHLLWEPNRDEKALIREFMEGYYGAAAPHLLAYFDVIDDAGERFDRPIRCFVENTVNWLQLEDLNKATELFDKAQKAVEHDPVCAERVRRERLTLDNAWLIHYYPMKRAARRTGARFLGPQDPAAARDEFLRQAERFDANEYRENQAFSSYAEQLRNRFRPASPPKLCENLPEADWVDLQDSEFRHAELGKMSTVVDDPQASDGKAARLPGDHHEWTVSCPVPDSLASSQSWHCYASVRCDATAPDGLAMQLGIYDGTANRGIAHRSVQVGESVGAEYRTIDLGVHQLPRGAYFWIAPPKRPGEVSAIYVDRIFLISEQPSAQSQEDRPN